MKTQNSARNSARTPAQSWTPVTPKPEGPIWVDFAPTLMQLPVADLVKLANIALNRASTRDIGEIFFDLGYTLDINFKKVDARDTQ